MNKMSVYLSCILSESEIYLLSTIATTLGYHCKLEKEKKKRLKYDEKDIIRAFRWLQNIKLTIAERGSHITWKTPLVGRIIINKGYVWFSAVPSS